MEIDSTKRKLFQRAFREKNEKPQDNESVSSSFLQNAIKGNQQLNKTIDATPQQVDDWYENELKVWADRQFPIIWIACAVQLSALGFMAFIMMINQYLFT